MARTGKTGSLRKRMWSIPTILGIAAGISFALFLSFRFEVKWDETLAQIRSIDIWEYGLAVALYYTSFWFRGFRWRILAINADKGESEENEMPGTLRFSQLILIGWFVNSVTWFRLGDAYRAYALSKDSQAGFSWSLGTIFAERVLDATTVCVLILVGVVSYASDTDSSIFGYLIAGALFLSVVLLVLLLVMRGFGAPIARFLPARLRGSYIGFRQGTLGGFKGVPGLLLLSLAGWMLEAGRIYFVVAAMDMEISMPMLLLAALGHAILSTVPTPGGVGAVEPGVTGILMLSFSRESAVGIAIADRAITYLSVIAFGLVAFIAWQGSRKKQIGETKIF